MKKHTEVRTIILQKLDIIRQGTEAAAQKVSREKMEKAADWLKEIHEQTKKLKKYCEDNLQ